nr:PREDICTED: uncharacterized protein LOC109036341 [Bemisia tabaci]
MGNISLVLLALGVILWSSESRILKREVQKEPENGPMRNLQAREAPDKIQTEPEIDNLEPTKGALLEPWARRLQPEISSWTPHDQSATDSAIKLTERIDVPLKIEPYDFLKKRETPDPTRPNEVTIKGQEVRLEPEQNQAKSAVLGSNPGAVHDLQPRGLKRHQYDPIPVTFHVPNPMPLLDEYGPGVKQFVSDVNSGMENVLRYRPVVNRRPHAGNLAYLGYLSKQYIKKRVLRRKASNNYDPRKYGVASPFDTLAENGQSGRHDKYQAPPPPATSRHARDTRSRSDYSSSSSSRG